MNYFAYHALAHAATQHALGDDCPVMVWNGFNIPCIPGGGTYTKEFTIGGFRTKATQTLSVNISDLPQNGQPTLGQSIIFENQTLRIETINPLPGGKMLQYNCVDPNQAA